MSEHRDPSWQRVVPVTVSSLSPMALSAMSVSTYTGYNDLPWMPTDNDAYTFFVTDRVMRVVTDGTRGTSIAPLNLSGWFMDCPELVSFDGTYMDTQFASSMASMFANDAKLTTLTGVGAWNVNAVTDMSHMFDGCVSLSQTSIDLLAGWATSLTNTSNVVSMASMFKNVDQLTDVTALKGWDTSKVQDMSSMFEGDEKLVDASSLNAWKVDAVTTMAGMFKGDVALVTVDISNWQMRQLPGNSRVVAVVLDNMFAGCVNLGQLTLGEASVLMGSAFNNSLATRGPTDGRWNLVAAAPAGATTPVTLTGTVTGYYPWFDNTGKLAERYGVSSSASAAALTYVWDPDHLGGRFPSNPYAWWSYEKNPTTPCTIHNLPYQTLTLGVDDHTASTPYVKNDSADATAYGFNVTENVAAATSSNANLPWL